MLNLEPIKQRLAAASPGPWNIGGTWWHDGGSDRRIVEGGGCIIATPRDCDGHRDAVFIGNAKRDVEALVAEVERLRSEMEVDCETLEFARWKIRDLKAKLKQADTVENKMADLINRHANKIDRLNDAIVWHKLHRKEIEDCDRELWGVLKDA